MTTATCPTNNLLRLWLELIIHLLLHLLSEVSVHLLSYVTSVTIHPSSAMRRVMPFGERMPSVLLLAAVVQHLLEIEWARVF